MKALALFLVLLLQVREVPEPPASIDGVVLDSQSGRPLAGATVLFQSVSVSGRMTTITRDDGTFVFRNVPPGMYAVEANLGGYVPESYGVPLTLERMAAVAASAATPPLLPGQALSGIRLVMTPGGVLSGRLADDRGDVVVGVMVQALKTTYRNGLPERTLVQSVPSNDLGEFRFFMLKPGQYYIAAIPATAPATLRPMELSSIPLYYPGTIDANAAQPIELKVGETLGGMNFSSIPARNRRIAGGVQSNASDPVGVILSPLNGTASQQFTVDLNDGQFQFSDVVPGSYMLVARTHDMRSVIPLEVRNTDVLGTRIVLGPGYRIPVRVRIEGHPEGDDPEMEALYFVVRPETPIPGLEPETYSPFANGRFTIELLARDYRIDISRTVGHYVKSMTLNGVDVLNPGLRVASSSEAPLEIVVAKQFGAVEGRTAGRDTTVVLVPDPARRGQRGLFRSVKAGGTFRFEKVPPGDYKLFVWDNARVENGGPYLDPEYLRRYEDRGVPVRIEGDKISTLDRALSPLLD